MKALLLHCKNYKGKIIELSDRPKNIIPEDVEETEQDCKNCIVVLLTVEEQDRKDSIIGNLFEEIKKMSEEIGINSIVVLPFAHLSSKLADSKTSIYFIDKLEEKLNKVFNVVRAHFGSHKELILHLSGHPGNVRFREF